MSPGGCDHKQPSPGPALGQVGHYKMCHHLSADGFGEFKSSAAWCVPAGERGRARAPAGAGLPLTRRTAFNV